MLLRPDPAVHDALARWANDELRSTNAQIEFLLRRALAEAPTASARWRAASASPSTPGCSRGIRTRVVDQPDLVALAATAGVACGGAGVGSSRTICSIAGSPCAPLFAGDP
jgi:hypothetical protein